MEGTLYDLLGLPETASREELKKRWRALAFELHPDRLQAATEQERRSAEARFSLLSRAWETLGDPERRTAYDARLRAHREGRRRAAAEMERRRREALQRQAARRQQPRPARVQPVTAPQNAAPIPMGWILAGLGWGVSLFGNLVSGFSSSYAVQSHAASYYYRAPDGGPSIAAGARLLPPEELRLRVQLPHSPFATPVDLQPGGCILYSDGSEECIGPRRIRTKGANPPHASKRSAAAR